MIFVLFLISFSANQHSNDMNHLSKVPTSRSLKFNYPVSEARARFQVVCQYMIYGMTCFELDISKLNHVIITIYIGSANQLFGIRSIQIKNDPLLALEFEA